MTTYTLKLPWDKPPMNLNDRYRHWSEKSNLTKEVRLVGKTLGKMLRRSTGKPFDYMVVELHWRPERNHRRDPSNYHATQKPLLDGLVDAGVVKDDTPKYVEEKTPVIHPADKELGAAVWLELTPKEKPTGRTTQDMPENTLKYELLNPKAKVPLRATTGAAGMDLYAVNSGRITPGEVVRFGLGIAFEFPEGRYAELFVRSSLGAKTHVRIANGTGIIDGDYRGEVAAYLHNFGKKTVQITEGDRIVQLVVKRLERVELLEGAVGETDRGTDGFGSTGVL